MHVRYGPDSLVQISVQPTDDVPVEKWLTRLSQVCTFEICHPQSALMIAAYSGLIYALDYILGEIGD